ncbi:glycosyltransferase family 9 protein [Ferruginibacter albus]|uniref:glycosyltransferase family 9 protein n=1 Tax=Ferruginibacter albus TaxID=2875540 RepID=UPI001CC5D30D|nr:glycosyltransferase family 9 protein [Ferruginibacter albus]UAY51382.1 glycosyltransferase family 9 protein [Ferruginibacter albus]
MKFLVIRLSSIGDIVLASPVLRCLKQQVTDAEVHFLTKSSFKIVTEANPYIDKFFYYNNNMDELIEDLKEENYDYIIDLHNNIRTLRIKTALKVKSNTINKLNTQKFLLTKLRINLMPGIHITKRSLQTVESFGVKDDGFGLDYFIPEKDIVPQKDIPTSHLAGFIAIVIGASYFTKKLPVHKLKELCNKIDHPIILLGGKDDEKNGREIAAVDPVKIYNACGKFNLNESADLVRRSKLVISHDTGLQYIACAFNKQVLAIWGGTTPKLDVEPYYGSRFLSTQNKLPYENIIVPGLWCQPCSKFGKKKCPLGHFKCMELQNIDNIVQKVNERLKK